MLDDFKSFDGEIIYILYSNKVVVNTLTDCMTKEQRKKRCSPSRKNPNSKISSQKSCGEKGISFPESHHYSTS